MKVKKGVKLSGLKIQMRRVLIITDKVWRDHGRELVITSTTDGVHSPGSYHPYGYAVDCRTRYFTDDKIKSILKALHEKFQGEYDVVFEGNHIHIEYDLQKHGLLCGMGKEKLIVLVNLITNWIHDDEQLDFVLTGIVKSYREKEKCRLGNETKQDLISNMFYGGY